MLAIELGLPRRIPDLCCIGRERTMLRRSSVLRLHHSTSQLTVPLAQTRVSQEGTQTPWAGCAHPVPHASSLEARGRAQSGSPWGLQGWGKAQPQRCPLASRAQTRWMACGPGSGQRAQRDTVDGTRAGESERCRLAI